MKPTERKLSTIGLAAAIVLVGFSLAPDTTTAATPTVEFGINYGSVKEYENAGIKPNYVVMWAGPWVFDNWGYFDTQLATVKSQGVAPVIQFYYWGNDLNSNCWYNGCHSTIHGAWKDQAGWDRLARELVDHLKTKLGGSKAVIIIETEFNKGDMKYSQALDDGLAAKAWYFRNNYPNAVVAMGFGNWDPGSWSIYDKAVGASHQVGLQAMRGSTRDTPQTYLGVVDALVTGSQAMKAKFGKPVFIHDIALSTYPEPEWLKYQANAISGIFHRISDLKAAGVTALVYRANKDAPTATTKEYYGEAERHFGLKWNHNNTAKPAYHAWRNGVLAERGGASGSTSSTSSAPAPGGFTPTFLIKAPGEWWQEVYIQKTSHGISKVELRRDGGAWQSMSKSSWGAWTSSYNVKPGTLVEFQATSTTGAKAVSEGFRWMDGQLSKGTAGDSSPTTTSSTTAPASGFTPTFQIKAPGEWWQEVYIQKTSHGISKVQLRRDGGAWQSMSKSSWGAWTSSYNVKPGTRVEFLATSTGGAQAMSEPFRWMDGQLSQPTAGAATSTSEPAQEAPSSGAILVSGSGSSFKEVESFTTKTRGGAYNDGSASGGKHWNLWSNGHVVNPAYFGHTGAYEVRVRALGDPAAGVNPRMEVRVGTVLVWAGNPGPSGWTDYVGKIGITNAGEQELRISYTNDASISGDDRNLLLDRVEFRRIS